MAFPSEKDDFELLYISSVGHSGSTLLNMLLNGHSQILGLSEVAAIKDFSIIKYKDLSSFNSPFWKKIRKSFYKKTQTYLKDLNFRFKSKHKGLKAKSLWLEQQHSFFESVSENTKAKIIVDTSKANKRLYWLLQSKIKTKRVLLIRDSRAVVYSYQKKYPQLGLLQHIKRIYLFAAWQILISVRWRVQTLPIHYKDLAKSPQRTLEQICNFLEIQYHPQMLNFNPRNYHGILGNKRRMEKAITIVYDSEWEEKMNPKDKLLTFLLCSWVEVLISKLVTPNFVQPSK